MPRTRRKNVRDQAPAAKRPPGMVESEGGRTGVRKRTAAGRRGGGKGRRPRLARERENAWGGPIDRRTWRGGILTAGAWLARPGVLALCRGWSLNAKSRRPCLLLRTGLHAYSRSAFYSDQVDLQKPPPAQQGKRGGGKAAAAFERRRRSHRAHSRMGDPGTYARSPSGRVQGKNCYIVSAGDRPQPGQDGAGAGVIVAIRRRARAAWRRGRFARSALAHRGRSSSRQLPLRSHPGRGRRAGRQQAHGRGPYYCPEIGAPPVGLADVMSWVPPGFGARAKATSGPHRHPPGGGGGGGTASPRWAWTSTDVHTRPPAPTTSLPIPAPGAWREGETARWMPPRGPGRARRLLSGDVLFGGSGSGGVWTLRRRLGRRSRALRSAAGCAPSRGREPVVYTGHMGGRLGSGGRERDTKNPSSQGATWDARAATDGGRRTRRAGPEVETRQAQKRAAPGQPTTWLGEQAVGRARRARGPGARALLGGAANEAHRDGPRSRRTELFRRAACRRVHRDKFVRQGVFHLSDGTAAGLLCAAPREGHRAGSLSKPTSSTGMHKRRQPVKLVVTVEIISHEGAGAQEGAYRPVLEGRRRGAGSDDKDVDAEVGMSCWTEAAGESSSGRSCARLSLRGMSRPSGSAGQSRRVIAALQDPTWARPHSKASPPRLRTASSEPAAGLRRRITRARQCVMAKRASAARPSQDEDAEHLAQGAAQAARRGHR